MLARLRARIEAGREQAIYDVGCWVDGLVGPAIPYTKFDSFISRLSYNLTVNALVEDQLAAEYREHSNVQQYQG